MLCGKEQTQVPEVGPGDLAALTKLKHTHFGDTIAAPGTKVQLPKIELPPSMVKLAISAKNRNDEDKLGDGLRRLSEEDPTFTHYRDPDTHEHVIRGMGDMQIDILMDRMKRMSHVEAETRTPRVAFKETIKGKADVQGKHKKQSGGHGRTAPRASKKLWPGSRIRLRQKRQCSCVATVPSAEFTIALDTPLPKYGLLGRDRSYVRAWPSRRGRGLFRRRR